MASRRDRRDDDWEDEASWQDEKRRRRLGDRKKDSRLPTRPDEPGKRKKRMSKAFDDVGDADASRRRWREAYRDDDPDADEESDFFDLDEDFDSDDGDDLRTDDPEDSGIDYSHDNM
jgi:hypothetical protein